MTGGGAVLRVRTGETVLAVAVLLVSLTPLVVPLPFNVHPAMTVATACWAAALVFAASRRPLIAVLATAPLFATINFWAAVTTSIVVFIATRRIRPARKLWLTVLVTGVAQTVCALLSDEPTPSTPGETVAGTVAGVIFLLLLPAVAGALLGQRKPMTRLLQERNEYLERAQALTVAKARTEERSHIAGEMHDMLGHRLSLISIHAGALELATAKNAPQVHEQAELLRTTAAIAMAELRDILGVLRANPEPESLDEHTGTRSDVTRLVEESRDAGIDVRLDWTGDDVADADSRSRRAIHRLVREGLTNVHKHARAARARVDVTVHSGRAAVVIVNGPTDAPPGLGTRRGLVGLEERVGLLGGGFAAGPAPEGGFRVAADVPLHPAAQAEVETEVPVEAPAPIAAEVLTMPRVVWSGCLGLLVGLPLLGSLVGVVLISSFGAGQLDPATFDGLRIGTGQHEIVERFGEGETDGGCVKYVAYDADHYRLCFTDGKLTTKDRVNP